MKTAIEHYEAALKEAFPSGATGDVFHHWNEARKAFEQPAQPYKGMADHIYQATDGRMRIDPVTGDVGVGTPSKQPAQDNTYEYAKNLAEAIFKQHYASDEEYASGKVVWRVFDTVAGILTQIDNMVAGMMRRPEQPAQDEPVAWINWCAATGKRSVSFECESELASEPLYAGITQNTQGHYSKFHSWFDSELHRQKYTKDHPAYLAAQEAWNAANDDAQHRINRLNAEIEAWKARFKIAEDALVKLKGMEREPVAWMYDIARYGPTDLRGQQWRPAISRTKPNIHDSLIRELTPLYTRPQARDWVGLTEDEQDELVYEVYDQRTRMELAIGIEAKLREKNGG